MKKKKRDCKVLIVEDEALIAFDISMTLQQFGYSVVNIVATADESIKAVEEYRPDVVIMDILLKGNTDGIEAAEKIKDEYKIPIIFLTTCTDDNTVKRATTQIPYGYLLKPFRSMELSILIELARQRHSFEQILIQNNLKLADELDKSRKLERKLQEISLVDELTGLYNRRGFSQLSRQQAEIAKRTGRSMLLGFFDLDHMKHINDSYGHHEGDNALVSAAGILRKIFRASDIIARWGGDEFAVLMINADCDEILSIDQRIESVINNYNDQADHRYIISMSWGIVKFDPAYPAEIDDLVSRADEMMYRHKSYKRL
ncbi:MAG TPA: diguanylate cyclase [Spirochaetota bacterium]|nr:diguanylate cyclase [Spirochaetota bacterium]HPC39741.1 diguanylate cyclase [Spirochaetota bacterium]HPL19079.1 diguanylate cyclase [Spirochaetota bacterium]HQF07469.1 diguanylate cyclase [Spirochaetota bacterium]HQH96729.1 diguanylate cyclase [Spirochaetota bacterium]